MKLAISILCENPHRRTGLSTLFHEFVKHALDQHPDVGWIVFAGPQQAWAIADARVQLVRDFPSNERRAARLWADHFKVGPAARRHGADALLTIGFVPLRTGGLPIIMHVFSVHHRRGGGGGKGVYRRAMIQRGLRRAKLVIANSQWTADRLGATRVPVLVSHEGLQHDLFSPVGEGGWPRMPGGYLLWVGNFYRYKRVELALAAYARLSAELRGRFPLLLVGGDWHGGRARAERAAQALEVQNHTHFLGWVKDEELPALYRGARAYLLSSEEETFGRSVAEAMACGCPCLLQDLPVLLEVTKGAALFVDFGDPAAAGTGLHRLCTDDELVASLRGSGLRRAGDFSFQRLARERVSAIKEIVAGSAV